MKGGYSMDKISRLSREIRQLEKSKKKLEELLKRSEKQQEVDRKEIAKKMKEKGTDITYIIEITGLTEEEIKEL